MNSKQTSQTNSVVLVTSPTIQTSTLLLHPQLQKKVEWDENVVDNEHLNKKSSKKCCIYHKPRQFGESSSESSDEDPNFSRAKHHHNCTNKSNGFNVPSSENKDSIIY